MRPEVLAEHVALTIRNIVTPMRSRLLAIETLGAGHDAAIGNLEKSFGDMRERLAVVESREPVPGPAGPAGPAGKDGTDGKDGAPGTPGLRYLGVYVRGKAYDVGDLVTWDGSAWHCNAFTTAAPATSPSWTLMVKRGHDAARSDRVRV